VTDTEWVPAEDGRCGADPVVRESSTERTTTFLIALKEPTRCLHRVTIKEIWGGNWSVIPGRVWPIPSEDDAA
jgi:hypothetical protein